MTPPPDRDEKRISLEDIALPAEDAPLPPPARLPPGRGLARGLLALALMLAGAGAVWWGFMRSRAPEPVATVVLPGDAELAPASGQTPASPFLDGEVPDSPAPVEASPEAAPTPAPEGTPSSAPGLRAPDASDEAVAAALVGIPGGTALLPLLVDEALLRNFVVTVDNLPNTRLPLARRVLKPVPGRYAVRSGPEGLEADPANSTRYAPLVEALVALPPPLLATVYGEFQPLLEAQWRQLGNPAQAFHTRLLEVIDHLLAAAPLPPPVMLVQPKVFYRHADPQREQASAGHRALWRLAPDQMQRVQAWLRDLRGAL